MANVTFAAGNAAGNAGNAGAAAAAAGPNADPQPPADADGGPPAGDTTITWENLLDIDNLPEHSIARGLAAKYNDCSWDDVMAPFDMEYHADPDHVKRTIAHAPAAKYVLAVNNAGSVQLIYGIRFCHVVQGQGERLLALGGERLRIAGTERPPDLLTLAGNIAGQTTHFGIATVRAPTVETIIGALDADSDLRLVNPLAADPNNQDANPEVVARRALVIHPKLGLLFLQPQAPHKALRLIYQIQQALPGAYHDRLQPLLNFGRLAITATAAGGAVSHLQTSWQRLDHGTSQDLVTWYYELVGTCAERFKRNTIVQPISAPTASDPLLGQALNRLANSQDTIAARKATDYKPHELDLLYEVCKTPIDVDRERDISDLPPFWVDFHKHRGKVNDARSYIERHFEEHTTEEGALDSVVFSHQFVLDFMGHNLYGRDRMTEFKLRFRDFPSFR